MSIVLNALGLKHLVRMIDARVKNQLDVICMITGNRGSGKSTLGLKLCNPFPQYNMKEDLVFGREEVMQHLAKKTRGIIHADEMINVTHNRDFYNQDQKKLIKGLNMYRDRENILIGCVPNFYDLDKQIRSLVTMRIDVVRRGLGVLHLPNQSAYSTDKWDSQFNEKLERKWLERGHGFKPAFHRLTTFKGYLKFGDIGVAQRRLYLKLKDERRGKVFEEDLAQDKSTSPYDIIYAKIKEGKIKKEHLLVLTHSMDVKYQALYRALAMRAKDDGVTLGMLFNDSENIITSSSKINDLKMSLPS